MISIEELMTGNLLRLKDSGEVIRVTSIDSVHGKVGYLKSGFFLRVGIGKLEPIRADKQMFEQNGFVSRKDNLCGFEEYVSEDNRIIIRNVSNIKETGWNCHVDNSDMDSVGCCDFEYIHELQNILTTCKSGRKIEL